MTKFRTCGMLTLLALVFLAAGVAAAGEPTAVNALRAAVAVQRALPRAPQLPRTDFLDARALSAVTLSPAGDFVAWLRSRS